MKNSYRNFPVYGTSALKYEECPELKCVNIVEFPVINQSTNRHVNRLRLQRETKEADLRTKVDIVIAFIVGCAISYGTVFTMI